MKTASGFRTILKRDKLSTFIDPKRLHITKIENLRDNPYYITRSRAEAIHKPTRGLPLKNGKPDF